MEGAGANVKVKVEVKGQEGFAICELRTEDGRRKTEDGRPSDKMVPGTGCL